MKLTIELSGSQTQLHCSGASSVNHCEKLNITQSRCKMFNEKVHYDFDEHAYFRCVKCLDSSF